MECLLYRKFWQKSSLKENIKENPVLMIFRMLDGFLGNKHKINTMDLKVYVGNVFTFAIIKKSVIGVCFYYRSA